MLCGMRQFGEEFGSYENVIKSYDNENILSFSDWNLHYRALYIFTIVFVDFTFFGRNSFCD